MNTADSIIQRDATQRESLSNTIRALRADALRQTTEMERLQSKFAEAHRRLGVADAAERALKLQLKSAEQAARGLKEEVGRMRTLVAQTRAQCANEVRKRERVVEGLKRHVGEGGRARGSGKAVGVATISVVAGVGGSEPTSAAVGVEESAYDLRQETNEFLTELAKGLSEENENLGSLLRRTVEGLKALSGWEKEGQHEQQQEGGLVVSMDDGYESIAAELEDVIEHLRNLLTNPSFVPLEEVEVREEEILRLREGWERMESRWRDAVRLMDGWRKRMARSGQTVNLEELKAGLSLSPVKVPEVEGEHDTHDLADDYEEGDTQADIDAMDDSQVPCGDDPTPDLDELSDASSFEEPEEFDLAAPSAPASDGEEDPIERRIHEREEQEHNHEWPQHSPPRSLKKRKLSTSDRPPPSAHKSPTAQPLSAPLLSSSPVPAPPQLSPLRALPDANNRRKSAFATIVEEDTWDLAHLDDSETHEEIVPVKSTASPAKTSGGSRLPRPREAPQSPLTMAGIAAKLAATEREADAARVRAKLRAAKMSAAAAKAGRSLMPPEREDGEEKEPVKGEGGVRKRTQTGRTGRQSRRRSTLSPWELESLILGGVAGSPAK